MTHHDLPYSPLSASADPETSAAAAVELVASGEWSRQARQVLAALQMYPGSTSAELAASVGLDRHLCGRRLPDLERQGLVYRGEVRPCRTSKRGLRAVTWWPVEPGRLF